MIPGNEIWIKIGGDKGKVTSMLKFINDELIVKICVLIFLIKPPARLDFPYTTKYVYRFYTESKDYFPSFQTEKLLLLVKSDSNEINPMHVQ